MTNLETLQKQQLDAMNQMYALTLNAATGMTPMEAPQNNVSQLESQLAEMQASMQQMMQIINQQQQMIQAQQMVASPAPVYAEPVVTKQVVEPAMAAAENEDIYKVSSKIVKPCDSCPFAQTCGMSTKQGIGEQCGQEVMTNKQIMLQGGKMQARFNFVSNEVELLSNGKVVSVIQDIKSNQNKKFINYMVKNNQVVDIQVVSDQKQPNSIYTTCTIEVLGFAVEDVNVATAPSIPATPDVPDAPMSEPVFVHEEEDEVYLSEDEMSYYDALASSFI